MGKMIVDHWNFGTIGTVRIRDAEVVGTADDNTIAMIDLAPVSQKFTVDESLEFLGLGFDEQTSFCIFNGTGIGIIDYCIILGIYR